MSVLMTLRIKGDASKLEEIAAKDPTAFKNVSESARAGGCMMHHFYASEGEIMVVDEWPSAEAFHDFFKANEAAIGGFMQAADVTSPPEEKIWRRLDLRDDIGPVSAG
jgi:hypothetical protein